MRYGWYEVESWARGGIECRLWCLTWQFGSYMKFWVSNRSVVCWEDTIERRSLLYYFLFDEAPTSRSHRTSLGSVTFLPIDNVKSLWYCSRCLAYRVCSPYPFIIRIKALDIGLGSMKLLNQCDYERVRCLEVRMHGVYGKQEFFDAYCFFWWHRSLQGKQGHIWKRIDRCGDR